jgi:nitroimidazol reductase NimA-like FMN-containing flavoprotein (pyridoxamine 5'-phosphate oxidase superfamily)
MADVTDSPVSQLSDEACWDLLKENTLGRLAVSAGGEIDIFPINYYADGHTILFRTAPGTKLVELTVNSNIAFEVDNYTDADARSVVVKGTARWLDTRAEIDEADKAPLTPWIPTLKYIFVRITPTSMSGRHFVRGPEPERY